MASLFETQSAIGSMPSNLPSGATGMSPEMMGALSIGGYNPIARDIDLGVTEPSILNTNMPTTPADDGMSNETMGKIMGTAQALSGLMGQFDAVKNQRSALKIKQIQNRINARFAKANFERKMTGLFQAHRDLEEQSMQQHTQREAAYQQKMGSMKVIQAETGAAGTSATETKDALTRSNLLAEQIQLGNMKKAQRSLMYQREGIADQRLAEELGFDMSNANIASQLQTPVWAQLLAGAPDLAIGGFNTYFNFVKNTGRSDSVT